MRRNEQICARVTADEMTALRTMAQSQSMLLSQFIRQALAEKLASLTTSLGRAERPVSHRRDALSHSLIADRSTDPAVTAGFDPSAF